MSRIETMCRAMSRACEDRGSAELAASGKPPAWSMLGYASQDAWVDENWPNFEYMVIAALKAANLSEDGQ